VAGAAASATQGSFDHGLDSWRNRVAPRAAAAWSCSVRRDVPAAPAELPDQGHGALGTAPDLVASAILAFARH